MAANTVLIWLNQVSPATSRQVNEAAGAGGVAGSVGAIVAGDA